MLICEKFSSYALIKAYLGEIFCKKFDSALLLYYTAIEKSEAARRFESRQEADSALASRAPIQKIS